MSDAIPAPAGRGETSRGPAGLPGWLWSFAAAALLARVLLWLQYRGGPLAAHPLFDAFIYWEWAGRIASGEILPGEPFHQAPLYPYLLAVGRGLVPGLTPSMVSLVQLCLNWGTALLLYPVTRRRFGGAAGGVAAVVGLLFAPAAFFALKLLPVTVGLALALGGFVLLDEGRGRRRRAGGGICWGLAGLCFPGFLLGLVALVVMRFRRMDLLPLAACILTILPVTAANAVNGGGFILVSANYGITFYQGNNPWATGGYTAVRGISRDISFQEMDAAAEAEAAAGRGLTAAQVARHYLGRGLAFIADRPVEWMILEAKKVALLVSGRPVVLDYALEFERRDDIPLLWLLPVSATAVLMLTALSFRTLLRGGIRPGSLAVTACSLAFVCLVFYVSDRYALPFHFLLIPAAAAGASAFRQWIADLRSWATALPVLACAAAFPLILDVEAWEANYQANRGYLYGQWEQRLDLALSHYGQSLAIRPDNPEVLAKVADIRLFSGEIFEAIDGYRTAITIDPFCRAAREGLIRALRYPGLREDVEREVAADPGSAIARFHRSQILWAAGDDGGALREIEAALAIDPGYCGALNMLAIDEYVGGNYRVALLAMRRAEACGFPVNPSFRAALEEKLGAGGAKPIP